MSSETFTPKLISMLREGYRLRHFQADVVAGLTVAVVALPLSMAIAIGSGAKPEHGLIASVVAGFLISALGGSRHQIGGPAGAFIVLVASIIETHGYQGFLAATMMGGALMLGLGYLRLGGFIKYIPHAVTVGFTAGIGVIILVGEIKDFLGLRLDHEPSSVAARLLALWRAADAIDLHATAVAGGCLALILALRRLAPRFPGMLAAVTLAAFCTWAFGLPVETIGTKFGGIPSALPAPALPDVTWARLPDLLPAAVAIALLGGLESLLSAVVADGMTGRRHRSNCELVAQGWANIASALFGGLCATGTIARTATNIRAHAHGPVAGMLHAVFLLAFMLVAAPLARWIPLPALAAVLVVVAWNMVEKEQIRAILRSDKGEAAVLLTTFAVTVFRDLTEGIMIGVVLGALLFMHRMATLVDVGTRRARDDDAALATAAGDGDVVVFHVNGPLFFGAAAKVAQTLDQIETPPRAYILDLSGAPLVDASGAHALAGFAAKARQQEARILIAGASHAAARALRHAGLGGADVVYAASISAALKEWAAQRR